jgi:hypothetical protein
VVITLIPTIAVLHFMDVSQLITYSLRLLNPFMNYRSVYFLTKNKAAVEAYRVVRC